MTDFKADMFGNSQDRLYRPNKNTAENEYHSGLPGQDLKYLQGREHRIYKDDKGEEVF